MPCFVGWMLTELQHIWCAILLNDMMYLHMFSLSTIVPEGPGCVFYAVRHQVYWDVTHVFFLLIIWFDVTQPRTKHTGANGLTDPYHYKLTPTVMCSQELCVLHWMNHLLISKNCFTEFAISLLFKNYLLAKEESIGKG